MAAPPDRALVTLACGGDRAAFGELVERHHAALLRACRGSGDAAQDAVLIALSSLPSLHDADAFGPWLCGIGRNLWRREMRAPAPVPACEVPTEPPDLPLRYAVLAAVAALPRGQREAVALFYLADLSHAGVADRLGISVGAVKTRLNKARGSLRARLADLDQEPRPMSRTVPMHVADVIPAEPLHILLLEEEDGDRRLPIWIPPAEGTWLAKRLGREDHPRPDTYRFTADLLEAARVTLREVRVVRLAETIFYAEAVLPDGTAVDARPSDAINLALVCGAPIRVDERVLEEAAKDEAATAAMLEDALTDRMTARERGG